LLRIYGLREEIPLPLSRLLWIRRLAGQEKDALAISLSETKSVGKYLNNPYLARILADDELGTWALDVDTLNLLESEIRSKHPKAILEFGCGISTICLARYMYELYQQDDVPRVYSIEQDRDHAQAVTTRLSQLGLGRLVKVIYAPLQGQMIEGIFLRCYQLPAEVGTLLSDKVDFIVIDGPAAEDGARFGTLPLVKSYIKGDAVFFLDDALRDGELQTGWLWSKLPYVDVWGVYLIGKGLLAGLVHKD
jgi:predicted O-methyltransferase YrrM